MAIALCLVTLTQNRLKRLCRAIYYSSVIFLVFLYIYVFFGHITNTLETRDKKKRNPAAFHTNTRNITCSDNTFPTRDGCEPCPNGTFSFPGWRKCESWLNCSDIAFQVQNRQRIHGGFTKKLWLAELKGHKVAYLKCRSAVKTRCLRGMTRLEKLQSPFVTRLIGKCYEKREIVTMYYKHGSAKFLGQLLQKPKFSQYNNIQTRFQLIVDYVKIMNYMHNSPIGILVMCNTANMGKLLSQYLITDDFHMVVNDLDNTPDVREGNGILCNGVKQNRSGQWFAPEQRCPSRLDLMPDNNEKVEIWKIPAIFQKLLGGVHGSSFVISKLEKVMKRCQATNPRARPSANELLQELFRVHRLITQELPPSIEKADKSKSKKIDPTLRKKDPSGI